MPKLGWSSEQLSEEKIYIVIVQGAIGNQSLGLATLIV